MQGSFDLEHLLADEISAARQQSSGEYLLEQQDAQELEALTPPEEPTLRRSSRPRRRLNNDSDYSVLEETKLQDMSHMKKNLSLVQF